LSAYVFSLLVNIALTYSILSSSLFFGVVVVVANHVLWDGVEEMG
jgi:hypothetical protein